MHEQAIATLDALGAKADEMDAVCADGQAWENLRAMVKDTMVQLESCGQTVLAARLEREYGVLKDYVRATSTDGKARSFDAMMMRDAAGELRSTMVALARFRDQLTLVQPSPAATRGDAPSRVLPDRAARTWQQYTIALQRGRWEQTPTDREAWEWCHLHLRLGAQMPNFLTWQRYLREARRFHGAQKNTPRAGRWR